MRIVLGTRGIGNVQVGRGIPTFTPRGSFDVGAEDDRVVQFEIFGPNELGSGELSGFEGGHGPHRGGGELSGEIPVRVVEVDGPPFVGKRRCFDLGVGAISIERTVEEVAGAPVGVADDIIAEFEDETAITDAVAVFKAGLGVGVVFGEHGDGHWVLGEHVDGHHVVRHESDRIHGYELPVDVEGKPVVGIDRKFNRIVEAGFHQPTSLRPRAGGNEKN